MKTMVKTFKGERALRSGLARYAKKGWVAQAQVGAGKTHLKLVRGLIFLPLAWTGRDQKYTVTFVKAAEEVQPVAATVQPTFAYPASTGLTQAEVRNMITAAIEAIPDPVIAPEVVVAEPEVIGPKKPSRLIRAARTARGMYDASFPKPVVAIDWSAPDASTEAK